MNETTLTDWREAVMAHLRENGFPAPARVEGRPRDDNASHRDHDLVCVWWPGWDTIERDLSLAQPRLMVRAWPGRSKLSKPTQTDDPAPLERIAMRLMLALPRSTQEAGFFVENLSCRIRNVVPSYEDDVYRVEAELIAYTILETA